MDANAKIILEHHDQLGSTPSMISEVLVVNPPRAVKERYHHIIDRRLSLRTTYTLDSERYHNLRDIGTIALTPCEDVR